MLRSPKIRTVTRRPRLGLVLALGAALVPLAALAVYAQAEILPSEIPSETTTSAADSVALIRTHSSEGYEGYKGAAAPFSIPCNSCHVPHKADNENLLQADGAAICATCHDLSASHSDPVTLRSLSAASAPVDCLACHPHSSGFMPVLGAASLTLTAEVAGYDDLDEDGNLSPGDRVHYRIDYGNPGPEDVTGALLRDELDTAHVVSVEAITGGGIFDGTTIQWEIGTLAAAESGFVTYDVVLQGARAFGGSATTATTVTTTAPPATGSLETTTTGTTEGGPTTTTGTTESPETTTTAASESSATSTTTASESLATTESPETTTTATSESPTTTESHVTSTVSTTTSAGGPIDVVNTAVLIAESREPVSTSAVISVAVAGSASKRENTTTTTLTTIVAGPGDVVNTVVLAAENREPVSASVVVSVVVDGLPRTESPTTATTERPMTVPDPSALTLTAEVAGYDDLDEDGNLSPGDRVHYRIDYGNPGPEDVTGALLRDELDTAHVASVEAITGGGIFDGTAIQWEIGTLAAAESGFVTYDVVLQGALAFGGSATTATTVTTTAPPATGSLETTTTGTTEGGPTTTTGTTESGATTLTDPPATESPTTTLSARPGPEMKGLLVAAALAVFPLAGAANLRSFSRKTARRRGTKPPERH